MCVEVLFDVSLSVVFVLHLRPEKVMLLAPLVVEPDSVETNTGTEDIILGKICIHITS